MNMLIKESELIKTNNILSQLNEAVYLTQEESQINASEVPVVVKENGINMVDYEYINTMAEQNGIGLFEALSMIGQSN
jgi:archaellum component FlaF (FlaF/FlaG flagellin family)